MIYLLEDDDNIRKLIKYSLTSQGLETRDFALPSEFWNSLQKVKPDLIILDIMLPEEDGIFILRKLRSNQEYSSIPVIMLTAKDSEYDVVTGLDAGADDYVTKPFGMMILVSRIKAVFGVMKKMIPRKKCWRLAELNWMKISTLFLQVLGSYSLL